MQTGFRPRTKQEMQDPPQTPADKVHAPLTAAVDNRLIPRRDFATFDCDADLADAESLAVNRDNAVIIEMPGAEVVERTSEGSSTALLASWIRALT